MKASDIRCGLFATRMDIAGAMEYFAEVTENDPFALTGLMVMLNTIADTLDREGLQVPFAKHNEHVVEWKRYTSDQGTALWDFPYND